MATHRAEIVEADGSLVPGFHQDPLAATELLDSTQEIGTNPEDILAESPDARDVAAELAAPPRRKLPWLTLLLATGVIAAGAFAGGAYVEKNNNPTAANPFTAARSGAAAGAGRTGTAGAGSGSGSGSAGSGSTTGTVKLIDGNTIYVTDSSGNVVKVTTGSSTTVSVAKTGKTSDLQPGQTVTIRGTTDSTGNVAASSVTEGGTTFGGGGGGGFGGGAPAG
ncbi:putative membrane protein YgcG [Streptacidiphilus sp. MAP12-16]|uniref:hypothetical protein n=1 Tax=Streptacidiphilus sp. MAP12-16 TaxID=3156300 RepID=UPI003516DA8B